MGARLGAGRPPISKPRRRPPYGLKKSRFARRMGGTSGDALTMGWMLLEGMREHKVDKVFPLPLIHIINSCRNAATSLEQGLGGTVLE